jgi:hypothetical protein
LSTATKTSPKLEEYTGAAPTSATSSIRSGEVVVIVVASVNRCFAQTTTDRYRLVILTQTERAINKISDPYPLSSP